MVRSPKLMYVQSEYLAEDGALERMMMAARLPVARFSG